MWRLAIVIPYHWRETVFIMIFGGIPASAMNITLPTKRIQWGASVIVHFIFFISLVLFPLTCQAPKFSTTHK